MPWWIPILIMMATFAISRYLTQKMMEEQRSTDDMSTEIRFSRVRYGIPLPVIWGWVRIGGQYIELGNHFITEKEEEIGKKAGAFVTYENNFHAGVALCMGPVDELRWLELGSYVKTVDWTRVGDKRTFGPIMAGIERGDLFWGTTTQLVSTILNDPDMGHPNETPAYRSICYAAMHLNIGAGTSLPAFSWEPKRWAQPLAGKPAAIGDHANPAQTLYDILTGNEYMLKLGTSKLDTASFEAASDVLVSEGLGGSIAAEQSVEGVQTAIDQLLGWIGGALVEYNGKIYLKLRRGTEGAISISEADIEPGLKLVRPSWTAVKAGVYLEYSDSARKFSNETMYLQNPAVREMNDSLMIERISFQVSATRAMAQKVAARYVHWVTYPYAAISLTTTKEGIHQEDMLDMSYAKRLEVSGYWRVMNVESVGNGKWLVEAIEHVDQELTDVVTQASVPFNDEVIPDTGVITWYVRENYYRDLLVLVKKIDLATPEFREMSTMIQHEDMTIGSGLRCRPNYLGTVKTELADATWIDRGNTLEVEEESYHSLIDVSNEAWFAGGLVLWVGDPGSGNYEIIFAQDVTRMPWGWQFDNLLRGMELTGHYTHPIGKQVYWLNRLGTNFTLASVLQEGYAASDYKGALLSFNGVPVYIIGGIWWLDYTNESSVDHTYDAMRQLPLPVANVQIGSMGNKSKWTAGVNTVFNWKSRSRLGGAGRTGAGTTSSSEYTAEQTQFKVEVRNSSMVLVRTLYVTDETWTYTDAQRVSDGISGTFYLLVYPVGQYEGVVTTFTAEQA